MSDSLRIVDFAIGLVNSVLNLLDTRQMNFFRKFILEKQAWIHTSFHCFTEIGPIFHNKYIFSKNFKLSKSESGQWFGQSVNILICMTQKLRKRGFGELKSKTFPWGPCPLTSLEVGIQSVFILDLQLRRTVINLACARLSDSIVETY